MEFRERDEAALLVCGRARGAYGRRFRYREVCIQDGAARDWHCLADRGAAVSSGLCGVEGESRCGGRHGVRDGGPVYGGGSEGWEGRLLREWNGCDAVHEVNLPAGRQ